MYTYKGFHRLIIVSNLTYTLISITSLTVLKYFFFSNIVHLKKKYCLPIRKTVEKGQGALIDGGLLIGLCVWFAFTAKLGMNAKNSNTLLQVTDCRSNDHFFGPLLSRIKLFYINICKC